MREMREHLLLDVGGAAGVCAFLAVGLWYAALKPDSFSGERARLAEEVGRLAADMDQFRLALSANKAAYQQLDASVTQDQLLPETTIDVNLARLANLAEVSRLSILEVVPLPAETQGEIRQSRYLIKAGARFAGLLRFFAAFESCDLWADITHMRIADNAGQPQRFAGHAVFDATQNADGPRPDERSDGSLLSVEFVMGFFSKVQKAPE